MFQMVAKWRSFKEPCKIMDRGHGLGTFVLLEHFTARGMALQKKTKTSSQGPPVEMLE